MRRSGQLRQRQPRRARRLIVRRRRQQRRRLTWSSGGRRQRRRYPLSPPRVTRRLSKSGSGCRRESPRAAGTPQGSRASIANGVQVGLHTRVVLMIRTLLEWYYGIQVPQSPSSTLRGADPRHHDLWTLGSEARRAIPCRYLKSDPVQSLFHYVDTEAPEGGILPGTYTLGAQYPTRKFTDGQGGTLAEAGLTQKQEIVFLTPL